jgi:hypothetical protein
MPIAVVAKVQKNRSPNFFDIVLSSDLTLSALKAMRHARIIS